MLTYSEYRQKASRYAKEAENEADSETARMLREVSRNWMTLAENHERFVQRATLMGLKTK